MDKGADPKSAELQRLASLEPPMWCKAAALAERVAFRLLRIIVAAVIAAIAIWLFRIAGDTLGEPFASLSPLGLVGGILAGVIGLLVIGISIMVAFGSKRQSRIEQAWRERQGNAKRLLGYDD
ncbi:MAG: hypothetical protein FD165_2408 [Gammaproteobacteria bacterium]|nr:MAG: hypothetical protein FD165_2408 [Gammaproteobacteria bacterium]